MPGYYLSNPSLVVEFPVRERYGSAPYDIEEGDLVHETERGKRWVYKQFTRRVIRLQFRVTALDLQFFRDLHILLGGQETAFWFMPDVDDSSGTAILVRKERNFQARELGEPAVDATTGEVTAVYDYEMVLTEEPSGAEVSA